MEKILLSIQTGTGSQNQRFLEAYLRDGDGKTEILGWKP
jgi:hypothetical protein